MAGESSEADVSAAAGGVWRAVERLGLPAVLVILFFWQWTKQLDREQTRNQEERAHYQQSIEKLSNVVDQNTKAIIQLTEVMGRQATELHTLGERQLAVERRLGERGGSRSLARGEE